MYHRKHYRRLTIAEAKRALAAGYSIIAAEGDAYFRSEEIHSHALMQKLDISTTQVHRTAFMHLINKGFIRLNEAKSKLPPKNSLHFDRRQGYYAVWEPVPEKLATHQN